AGTEVFSLTADGISVTFPPGTGFCNTSPCPTALLSINIQVDNNGNLIGGNPAAGQPDLVLTGQVTNGATTYTSPLLTGSIMQFYFDGVNDTPNFAFRFAITGGSMAGLYANSNLWVTLTLEEQNGYNDFSGSFANNFAGSSKGNIFSTPVLVTPPPSVTCAAVSTGEVGVPFNSGPMTVTGGIAPYSYSIVGVLPAGLTLNTSTGAVSGTPTTAGTFTVMVTDSNGNSGSSCLITINGPLTVTCGSASVGDVGVPFDSGPMTVTGGTAPYSFSILGVLPPGLTLNTSTGEVTGLATSAGSFTIQVTDALGNTSTGCLITINGPLYVTCAAIDTGDVGVPFNSGPMTVMGGTAPYSFSIVGTLPTGLTLNTSTGAVTGTPTTAGSFTVEVTDALGYSSTSCTITINGPLSVTCAAVTTGDVGVPFNSGPMTITGGTAPYSFSIVGTLPTGLTLNTSTGAVTGTPTTAGTFTVRVTDATGNSSTSCIITINGPLSVTCAAIDTGDVGVPFNSGPMTVTGGTAPYTFSILGVLPAGLTLNTSTGAVTGTPTAAGTFTVEVTDATGNTSTTCMITINGPLLVACAAINTGEVGVPFNSGPMNVTGGTLPYTYSIVGVLPAGLTLNTLTGAVSGTPTAAGTFTVEVTDAVGNSSTSCMITINTALSVTCAAVTAGEVNVPFNSGPMTVTGGTSPYTYSIVGTLPVGLTLNTSNGAITGTPTTAGSFSVEVTDASGSTSTGCLITINTPVTATCVAVNAIQGVAITPVTMVGSGGAGGPYTFTATGLPPGLSISSSGTISGIPTASGTFNYTVTVTDSAGNTGTVNCSVTVAPPVSATCVTINAVQGFAITPVTMVGSGGAGGPYTFTATGLPPGIVISTSGTISGTPTSSGTYNYTVTVTDSAGNTGTVNCSVTVAPVVSASCLAITAVQGVAIPSVTMVGSGGAGGPYSFSATGLPAGVTMSPTGTISGTPTSSGTFNYTVTVTDSAGHTGTVNCSVPVAPPPSATCVSITAIQGVAITPVTMVGSGGSGGPYTFSATGLPAGLTISTSGTISGTPTASGTFNYTVTVTDSAGHTGTVNCSVTVAPPVSATCVSITAVQGVAITPVTMVGSGGSGGPYTFSATGLPAGLTISTSGTISGTPTASGTFNYTVTVTDSAGHTGTVNCSVTVAPPVSATCVSITAVQGVAITPVTMVGSGGSGGPYTFSATGLPAGLSISTSGTISGTPTASGTFSYTVTVTDSAGHTGTVNCSVTVAPPVSATCVSITAVQGVAITPVTMVGSGGSGGPYTFSATGLPAGLSISTSGTISGTATVNGTFSYTVTVTDSKGHAGTVNCSVTVAPPVSATCVAITAVQGVAITPVTMVGSGGSGGPYTFSATGLPTGLSISTSGTISGTPTASGTFNYTVTVTDSAGHTGTVNCSVTVAPQVSATCLTIDAVQGDAIVPATLVGSGGSGGPYTFTATGLPAGLTLSSSGTISGTPTVNGT
ncbi:MAG: putative Ig domain-containing protein, partial [Terracidiphilus sp.]